MFSSFRYEKEFNMRKEFYLGLLVYKNVQSVREVEFRSNMTLIKNSFAKFPLKLSPFLGVLNSF